MTARILVPGIGNIFLSDDGFGSGGTENNRELVGRIRRDLAKDLLIDVF